MMTKDEYTEPEPERLDEAVLQEDLDLGEGQAEGVRGGAISNPGTDVSPWTTTHH
jgi:hypothetical protein